MVVTIHTDTFEDSQKLYDLCAISGVLCFTFINDRPYFHMEDDEYYGIDIVIKTWEDHMTFQRISKFVFEYFKEKKDD